jgi:hypothetical protein
MYTGPQLGAAIREAMAAKKVTQAAVAKAFNVTQPSVSEWLRFGRIGKQHIPLLVSWFSDVVGPEHWGLPKSWGADITFQPADGGAALVVEVKKTHAPVPAEPRSPPPDFSDRREVSDSDWAALTAIKTLYTHDEIEEMKGRAMEKLQETADMLRTQQQRAHGKPPRAQLARTETHPDRERLLNPADEPASKRSKQ